MLIIIVVNKPSHLLGTSPKQKPVVSSRNAKNSEPSTVWRITTRPLTFYYVNEQKEIDGLGRVCTIIKTSPC